MADLSITAANVAKGTDAVVATGTAGATITAGQTVYLDSSVNQLKLGDADAQARSVVRGIALHGASSGQPIDYQTWGNLDLGATLTVGEIYVQSTTAGGIAPEGDLVSTDYVTVLGIATAADNLRLRINASEAQVP
jgi:hypothetical protein